MFQKRIINLDKDDIQRIVDEAVQEGSEVEFKETLPSKGGKDPWFEGKDQISDRARNGILEEIIAFANTYGGTLVLGIKETSNKPARAKKITPIPRCTELAERLKLQCRDCIDPQIPLIEVAGIPTQKKEGAGVVVIQLPQSRAGPHRHTSTKECYKRHADRTEKMTMREIQDLTLQLERGLSAIESKFSARAKEFSEAVEAFFPQVQAGIGVRLTLIPLSPIFLDRVHNVLEVRPAGERFIGHLGGGEVGLTNPYIVDPRWRPILRGSQGSRIDDTTQVIVTVMCDGEIQYSFMIFAPGLEEPRIYPGWLLSIVSNGLVAAEKFRQAAGAHSVEYGMELEIHSIRGNCQVGRYRGREELGDWIGPIPRGKNNFPRYSVGSPDEFPAVIKILERDFWNVAGHDMNDFVTVDFSEALD